MNKTVALDYVTLDDQVSDSLMRERLLATLSGFFGALALLLAIVGLYGVMSYNVSRRQGEIGIRMALGADRRRVLGMVLREVWSLVAVGLIAGLAGVMATTRLVSSFLYGVAPTDAATLVTALALLGIAATLAGYLPARRAAHADPATALREE